MGNQFNTVKTAPTEELMGKLCFCVL